MAALHRGVNTATMRARAQSRGQAENKYGEKLAAAPPRGFTARALESETGGALSEADDPLTRQLKEWRPRSMIAVGGEAERLLEEYAAEASDCVVETVAGDDASRRLQSLASERRYDFALVAGYLERVDSSEGGAVIARLRDVLARRLCVMVATDETSAAQTAWSDSEFSAFGLTLLSRDRQGEKTARLFGFDIASYKQTPDWLSPRHWAHPELWGKFRW